jgi:hypothetical protein
MFPRGGADISSRPSANIDGKGVNKDHVFTADRRGYRHWTFLMKYVSTFFRNVVLMCHMLWNI